MIRPSECPVTGRDAFDMILAALGEIVSHPGWLLRTALIPFIGIWGVASVVYGLDQQDMPVGGVVAIAVRWTLEVAVCLPCVLAWCRIGFRGAATSEPPRYLETTGLRQALDLLLMVMAAVMALALGLDLLSTGLTGNRVEGFPARGLVLFASGLVVIPGIMLGVMRLLIAVAAAAIGWRIDYREALVLTAERGGWLAGIGLTFLCLFPLASESAKGMRDLVGGPLGGIAGIWRGIGFGMLLLLAAASGHALGQALARLYDGMPPEPPPEKPASEA
jgi:hypothetical protein